MIISLINSTFLFSQISNEEYVQRRFDKARRQFEANIFRVNGLMEDAGILKKTRLDALRNTFELNYKRLDV